LEDLRLKSGKNGDGSNLGFMHIEWMHSFANQSI